MTKNINSESITFDMYYDSLPDGIKKKLVLEYMTRTEQSIGTFYNKKKNKKFTPLEKEFFEKYAEMQLNWA